MFVVISEPMLLSQCQRSGTVVLSEKTAGSIASSVVYTSRHGGIICPWVIEAEEGQRINISIMDFGSPMAESYAATCHIYANIIEYASPSTTILCSGTEREKVVYLSSSSRVEIQFIDDTGESTIP